MRMMVMIVHLLPAAIAALLAIDLVSAVPTKVPICHKKTGLPASFVKTRIYATNREPLLRTKREGHQQVPVAPEEVPGRDHQTFMAAPRRDARTCAESCFLGPEG
jgi:hypothetical protein